jgi:hypothetical protein
MEYINLPIPENLYTDVIRYIAKKQSALEVLASTDPGSSASPAGVWNPAEVRKLFDDSSEAACKFLLILAHFPDTFVSMTQILNAMKLDAQNEGRKISGILGALNKRCEHHFKKRPPYEQVWDYQTREYSYRMTTETAETINKMALAI